MKKILLPIILLMLSGCNEVRKKSEEEYRVDAVHRVVATKLCSKDGGYLRTEERGGSRYGPGTPIIICANYKEIHKELIQGTKIEYSQEAVDKEIEYLKNL